MSEADILNVLIQGLQLINIFNEIYDKKNWAFTGSFALLVYTLFARNHGIDLPIRLPNDFDILVDKEPMKIFGSRNDAITKKIIIGNDQEVKVDILSKKMGKFEGSIYLPIFIPNIEGLVPNGKTIILSEELNMIILKYPVVSLKTLFKQLNNALENAIPNNINGRQKRTSNIQKIESIQESININPELLKNFELLKPINDKKSSFITNNTIGRKLFNENEN